MNFTTDSTSVMLWKGTAAAGATHAEINYKLGNNYFLPDRGGRQDDEWSCRLGNEGGKIGWVEDKAVN